MAPQGRGCLPPLARLGSRSEVPVALASSRDVTARAEAGAGLLGGRPRAGAAEVTVAPYRQCQATALAACPDDAGHGAGRPVHHPMPREGGAWARGKGGKGEVRSWRRGACRAPPSLRPPRATGQCACRFMFMSCDVASGAAAAGWGAMQRGGARGQGTRVRADTCQGTQVSSARRARISRHLPPNAARRTAAEGIVATGERLRLELRVHDVGRAYQHWSTVNILERCERRAVRHPLRLPGGLRPEAALRRG